MADPVAADVALVPSVSGLATPPPCAGSLCSSVRGSEWGEAFAQFRLGHALRQLWKTRQPLEELSIYLLCSASEHASPPMRLLSRGSNLPLALPLVFAALQSAKGVFLPCVGLQDWGIQHVTQTTPPGPISSGVFSLFL